MRALPTMPRASPLLPRSAPPWVLAAGCAGAILFVFYCYWPLTRFYFSQDDFYFLEKASAGLRASMEQHFNTRPGHFRPLTKGLYFLVMWPLFGLNPLPYHIVSIVLHALNSILAGAVLRRLGVSRVVSCIAVLLFAANVIHLEAVAWISCVQQLLGATFAFLALIWGLDALATNSRARAAAATAAYALALGSYEQTLAVPLVLIAWQWKGHGWRAALQSCRQPLGPMLLLLLVYCGYVFGVRGLPGSGPYEMMLAGNVLDNLRQYAGSVFAIWLIFPYVDLPLGLRGSHVVWAVLMVWGLASGKWRELVFAGFAFLALLAPVLFIRYHVFGFHLYIPAIAALYLLGVATDSVVEMLAATRRRWAHAAVASAVLVGAAGSTLAVRKNLVTYCSDDVQIPQVRVLRRAVLAQQVCSDVSRRWPGGPRLVLVYGGRQDTGNWGNIQSALSDGRALRLVLHQPSLVVDMRLPDDTADTPPGEMMIVTELGYTFTYSEYQTIAARYGRTP